MKNNHKSQYEACVNMRIAEGQIQWERYNAMLVINTIFMGFVGFTFSKEFNIPNLIKLTLPFLGILLCLLWLQMTQRGFMWVIFWTNKAREIEIFSGDKNSVRPFADGKKYKESHETTINTRFASYSIIAMFIGLYLLILFQNVRPYL